MAATGEGHTARRGALSTIARAGFQDLSGAREAVEELSHISKSVNAAELLEAFSAAADPDGALALAMRIADEHPKVLEHLTAPAWRRLCLLIGASPAFGEFLIRHPSVITTITSQPAQLYQAHEVRERLLAAVHAPSLGTGTNDDAGEENEEVSRLYGEAGWNALRVKYRELLAEVALFDLEASRPDDGNSSTARECFEEVARAISNLADAALEAALVIAKRTLEHVGGTSGPISRTDLDAVRFSVIAMGKCGAQELNVVSDVDVMFVFEGDERIATKIARELMRAIQDHSTELPLWQVDANLRPEGRHGALVRTLPGMMGYYERWAKAWEFQALMKARASAGDIELGEEFVAATRQLVWSSADREDFVGSVQRMRQRVTEHIAPEEVERHLKLGPGGLRDIEFSVQLLQLVHGQRNERLHLRATLPALRALVDGGYVARKDGERLSEHYRTLRVLEHRIQLKQLRRTELMPDDEDELRALARATGFAATARDLLLKWRRVQREVRELHLKIFYAPLLSAVAALPDEGFILGTDAARARLAIIGFQDPEGAVRHLAALTKGSRRSHKIQRTLLPVLVQWFGEGTDPDFGLLAFRRISEANQDASWYLRLLRDGTQAAERLAHLLANSRFAAGILESYPEGVVWLEHGHLMEPPDPLAIQNEMVSLVSRQATLEQAASRLRRVHRREILRLAMGRASEVLSEMQVAEGLDGAHTALLDALLLAIRTDHEKETGFPAPEISLIGMGRFGGGELGFASDIDLVAVTREANAEAAQILTKLSTLVSDPRFPVDLDFALRPEGKNGPLVRSIDSYRSYYERWSVTWEAQALLRARHAAGSAALSTEFLAMADPIRYPTRFDEDQLREVRRMKARIEGERLAQGADPAMHLKLGPGGLSDVEWLVQLIQLQHGAEHPELQTVSTLGALETAVKLGFLQSADAHHLSEAWSYASTLRSALKLWSGRSSEILPIDWRDLEGIAGVIGHPRDQTSEIVERWRALSRRARAVFEREFFGYTEPHRYPTT